MDKHYFIEVVLFLKCRNMDLSPINLLFCTFSQIFTGSLSLGPGFARHNCGGVGGINSNLKDGFKGLDPKIFSPVSVSSNENSSGNGAISQLPRSHSRSELLGGGGAAAAATGSDLRSDEEYVDEDDELGSQRSGDCTSGGSGGKGKVRKKKTRTVFSRSQVTFFNTHLGWGYTVRQRRPISVNAGARNSNLFQ